MSLYEWFTLEWKDLTPLPKSEYLYGPRHVFCLAMIVVLLSLLVIFFHGKAKKKQDKVFDVIAYILIAEEVIVRMARMTRIIIEGNWSLQSVWYALVPSFFCSIVVWTLIINHFVKWKPLTNALAVGGIVATGGFYLWASVGFNSVELSMIQLYSITSHALALIYFLLQIIFHRVDFPIKKVYEPWLYFLASILYSWFLNLVIFPGDNYMYFMYDNMTWWAIPGPWWQFLLFVFLFAAINVFYLPGIIKNLINRKSAKKETTVKI